MVLPLKATWKLQLVQNITTWVMMSISWQAHVTHLLNELRWLSVCYWVQFKQLVLSTKPYMALCLAAGTVQFLQLNNAIYHDPKK